MNQDNSFLYRIRSLFSNQNKNIKLLKIFSEAIHPILHDIFTNLVWDDKRSHESLKDYIFRQHSPPSNKEIKEYEEAFDLGQKKKIDENKYCDRFDISLYFKAFLLTAKYNSKLT